MKNSLELAKEALNKAQERVYFLEAEQYLENLFFNASYRSIIFFVKGYKDNLDTKLFRPIDSYMGGDLLEVCKKAAKRFKDMDDSKKWPKWKSLAYKHSKVYNKLKGDFR